MNHGWGYWSSLPRPAVLYNVSKSKYPEADLCTSKRRLYLSRADSKILDRDEAFFPCMSAAGSRVE